MALAVRHTSRLSSPEEAKKAAGGGGGGWQAWHPGSPSPVLEHQGKRPQGKARSALRDRRVEEECDFTSTH